MSKTNNEWQKPSFKVKVFDQARNFVFPSLIDFLRFWFEKEDENFGADNIMSL